MHTLTIVPFCIPALALRAFVVCDHWVCSGLNWVCFLAAQAGGNRQKTLDGKGLGGLGRCGNWLCFA